MSRAYVMRYNSLQLKTRKKKEDWQWRPNVPLSIFFYFFELLHFASWRLLCKFYRFIVSWCTIRCKNHLKVIRLHKHVLSHELVLTHGITTVASAYNLFVWNRHRRLNRSLICFVCQLVRCSATNLHTSDSYRWMHRHARTYIFYNISAFIILKYVGLHVHPEVNMYDVDVLLLLRFCQDVLQMCKVFPLK